MRLGYKCSASLLVLLDWEVYFANQDCVWHIEKTGNSFQSIFFYKGKVMQFFWQRSKNPYGTIVFCINSCVVSLKDNILVRCKMFVPNFVFLPLFFSVDFYLFSEAQRPASPSASFIFPHTLSVYFPPCLSNCTYIWRSENWLEHTELDSAISQHSNEANFQIVKWISIRWSFCFIIWRVIELRFWMFWCWFFLSISWLHISKGFSCFWSALCWLNVWSACA